MGKLYISQGWTGNEGLPEAKGKASHHSWNDATLSKPRRNLKMNCWCDKTCNQAVMRVSADGTSNFRVQLYLNEKQCQVNRIIPENLQNEQ